MCLLVFTTLVILLLGDYLNLERWLFRFVPRARLDHSYGERRFVHHHRLFGERA